MRKILTTVLLTIAITSIIFTYLVNSETSAILKYWIQPTTVTYGNSRYRLSFMEVRKKINYLEVEAFQVGGKNNKYFFVVSNNQTKPELHFMFGHFKLYGLNENNQHSANGNQIDMKSYLEKCEVIWKSNGITIKEPSGHQLFIPQSSFVKTTANK